MKIYPSLISSDLLNLQQTLTTFEPLCAGYHLDVMDGHFVPNLTWGPMFINAIRKNTRHPLHVHLMVTAPTTWLQHLSLQPQDTVIFHYESMLQNNDLSSCIRAIRSMACNVGIAITPKTSVENIFDILPLVDHVLLMSVEPGFSGQKFIEAVITKIAPLIAKRTALKANFTIGMDGGVNETNVVTLQKHSIDYAAMAAAIFNTPNPLETLKNLQTLLSCKGNTL